MNHLTPNRYVSRILMLHFAATLLVPAFFGVKFISVIREKSASLTKYISSHNALADERIRLYEIALAAKPDYSVHQKAEEAFATYREEKGKLKISDPTAVQIVSIPEVLTLEHRPHSWRVFVPDGQVVQAVVAKWKGWKDEEIEPSEELYVQALPSGESVIQMIWVDGHVGRLKTRGLVNVPKDVGLKFIVGSNEFHLNEPNITMTHPASVARTVFELTTALFIERTQAKLGGVTCYETPIDEPEQGVQLWLRKTSVQEPQN